MTAIEDHLEGKHRYYAPEIGVVIDNVDPEGLHRVRVAIPGLIEISAWAYPIGAPGGGSAQRGGWTVPAIGATVVVQFVGGDVERPLYSGGWWGKPKGTTEIGTEAAAVPPREAHLVQTISETRRMRIWVDERDGKQQLSIADKELPELFIQVDLESGAVNISSLAAITIKSLGLVQIEGTTVTIQGRVVMPDSKPI